MFSLTCSRLLLISAMGTAVLLGGCASDRSARIYSPSEALNEARVRSGTVESVRAVRIQSDSELGQLIGAVIGGIAGSNVGKGSGSTVGAVIGATVGGAAGGAIGKDVNAKEGMELVLRMESGEVIAVVQEADIAFVPGQKIRVITRGRVSRVVPAN
ncbi:glycine zipper domain-containing protein [Chitinimonas sp. JJ19]|uniref:glycine zipper domain-containing protein n=1 Tax=Chitinimonas sp. JJ19 TaxID=3109352 RepID=UPI003001F1F9